MSDANKAVFLSYASQDAEAVRGIAESLRAAGVEVWFDQNELTGGDAWDAKIRGQIAACALFVPIVSAATQARHEGYFRLEWKLAAQRTHMMSGAKAFLLPVVIDETRDAEAHVPAEFRDVQWTRLPGGETPERFCARVKKILGGEGRDASPRRPSSESEARPGRLGETTLPVEPALRSWLVPTIIGVGAVLAFAVWRPWEKSAAPGTSAQVVAAGPQSRKGPEPETAASLAARALEHYYPFCTPGRLQLADEFSRRATELDPNYARGWGTRAGASARYLLRDWVSGEAAGLRARDAQSFANRALSLDKNESEALLALGIVAWHQRATSAAEALFRRVQSVDPANVQAPTLLSRVARENGRITEAVTLMKGAIERAPRDPMVRLYAGFAYFDGWNFRKASEQFEIASRVADFQGAGVYKAWADFFQHGDVARMRAEMDKLDLVYAEDDGKLAMNLVCGLYERRTDRVLETAGRSASTYIDDWWTPKAWFTALAYEIDHKDNLARQQWQAAEAVVRERLRADPRDEILRVNLAITLAKLGRTAEARVDFEAVEAAWREQMSPIRARRLARFHAATGNGAKAVTWLRQCVNRPTCLDENETPRTLELDPWWDGIRQSEEFRALLANPPPPPLPVDEAAAGPAKPPEKSIAVLAFKNLSGDPAREFFSEGLSEAVTDVLGRVPGLKVVASASAFSFKGKSVPIPEIARQLGVTHLVEGTVLQEGQTVRITAKLIKADGFQVWVSDKLDRELKTIFALHDEVAGLIAKNLSLKLGASSAASPAPVNPQAYELYAQARHAWHLRTTAGFELAEEALTRALVLEPNFARAHAALADVWAQRLWRTAGANASDAQSAVERARIQAKIAHALALDRNSADAYASLGDFLSHDGRDAEAEAALRRAVALNPNFALAHQWLGWVLLKRAHMDQALDHLKRATDLDPFAPIIWWFYGFGLRCAGRYSEAIVATDRALELRPDDGLVLWNKVNSMVALGRYAEALELVRPLSSDGNAGVASKILAYARAGLRPEAEALLAKPRTESRLAVGLLALGRNEEAMAMVTGLEVNRYFAADYLWDSAYDPLRNDPRWLKRMADGGLSEAHARAQAWRAAHPPEKPAAK